MNKNLLKWLGLVALLVSVWFTLRATLWKKKPVQVEVVSVQPGLVEDTVINSQAGSVRARRRANLTPEVSGRVLVLYIKEGDRVKAGDRLVDIDPAGYRENLAAAQSGLNTAQVGREDACGGLSLAERNRDRAAKLFSEGLLSQSDLDQVEDNSRRAQASCSAAKTEVKRAQDLRDVAKVSLEKTVIFAPFAGVIAEVNLEVGEWSMGGTYSASGSPLMSAGGGAIELLDPLGIYVTAPMDETDLAKLEVGAPARIILEPFPDKTFEGKVTRVAPYALERERQNRTVEVEAVFLDEDFAAKLIPGITADIEVIRESRKEVLRIPAHALREDGTVLVLKSGVIESMPVEVGLRNWRFAEITSGLTKNDQVVISLDREEVVAGARAEVSANPNE